MGQREQVLNEFSRYQELINKIGTTLSQGSDSVHLIKDLNYQIGTKNQDEGYQKARTAKIHNIISEHKILSLLGIYAVFFLLNYFIIMRLFINGRIFIGFVLPAIISIGVVIVCSNIVDIPMIKLQESEKTQEYFGYENQLQTSNHDLNQLISQYSAFYSNSLISGFIIQPNEIVGPTFENGGKYWTPLVGGELKWIVSYLQKHQAETIHEASMLYTQQMAYENQVESNNQIIQNTNDAARAAEGARDNTSYHNWY
ncbi:hypothetical protein [Companilactobacillus ginsenosidimutans]|uniref:Uncharacterized protein n=1 Tax=Companilactobacillus ginsenosidimutans TaxID=1007676 RepID=A0A0H4QKK1_9LACO|nr:hypothetical protein [Companilactobacillus ginsenosidimutans]AKP67611.1 hypothetical protein ABM34_08755 [Companilactobacillus ginsenosidimutans]